ncbi:MAG: oligosaccharide flippase family protein [Solirubrobacterales bacterium]
MSRLRSAVRDGWSDPVRRNLILTVGAGLLVQGMLVITGPFLARLLGPAGRGELAALMLWPVVLVQLGCLGIPAAVTYFVSAGSPWRETIRRGLRFGAWQVVGLSLAQVAIVLIAFTGRGDEVRDAALVTIAAPTGLLAQEYGQAILQARSDLKWFNVLRMLPITLFAIAVIAMFVLSAGLVAVTLSWVGAVVLIGVVTLTFALRRAAPVAAPAPSRDAPPGRALASYGIRGILSANSATDIVRPDQIALAIFLPSRALGIYVVGLAFTNLPYFFAKAIGLVAFPAVARESEPAEARRVAWRYLWIIIGLAVLIVGLLYATVAILIPLFFGDEFRDSVGLSYILLAGALFTAIRRVLAETMRGRGQPGPGTTAEIVALVGLVAAIAVLVPLIGVDGVAVALSASQLANFVVLAAIAIHRGELRRSEAIAGLKRFRPAGPAPPTRPPEAQSGP